MAQLPIHDPATGELIDHVELATTADCLTAADTAAEALDAWKRQAPRDRGEVLRRAFELMTAERESLAKLITRENGKVLSEARAEVGYAAEFFRWFAEEAVRVGGELRTAPGGDKRIVVLPHPVGVALLITPWNFPAAMATRKIAPALAAGCTVVLKPAPETPLTAFAVADLLQRAGVPSGVVNVVLPEPPGEAVRAVLAHPAIRKLSFTGSTEVGTLLLGEAAPHMIRCSMELGGNAPFLVFDDADLDLAVESALVAKLRNTGASCIAANRFYVHDMVAEEFTHRLAAAMAARRVDVGTAPGAEVGALVNEGERDRVAALVTGALDAGSRVRAGGHAPERPGAFYLPTVIDQVNPDADILRHEIFGPVAPVTTFHNNNKAVELANDSPVGLMSYVMTGDLQHGLRVAELIETGMVSLNRGLISDPAAPFGGMKGSGLGREGGFEGIAEYLELQYVGVSW